MAPTRTASNVMVVDRHGRIGADGLLSTSRVSAALRVRKSAWGANTLMATSTTAPWSVAARRRGRRAAESWPPSSTAAQAGADGQTPGDDADDADHAGAELELALRLAAPPERETGWSHAPTASAMAATDERSPGKRVTFGW